jgi:uncharacterized membrane protein YkvA (DUF1232 family)
MDRWPTAGIVVAVVAVMAVAAMVVGVAILLVKMVKIRSLLRSADVPGASKAAFWGSILYLVCPVDLLPDPIFLDDIGLLLLALRSLKNTAQLAGFAADSRGEAPAPARESGDEDEV